MLSCSEQATPSPNSNHLSRDYPLQRQHLPRRFLGHRPDSLIFDNAVVVPDERGCFLPSGDGSGYHVGDLRCVRDCVPVGVDADFVNN